MTDGTGVLGSLEGLVAAIKFDSQGLVPVVVQELGSGQLRMMAFANADALRATARSGLATFWSRSRNELWEKGATSGHRLRVSEVRLDCDGDTVLYVARTDGPSCHTGAPSCFFRAATRDGELAEDAGPEVVPSVILQQVATVIAERRRSTATKSYVKSLLEGGAAKISAKISEESAELCEALTDGSSDRAHVAHEAADLLFHVLVGLEASEVPLDDVFAVLRGRFGTSGHVEKANRPATPANGG